MAVPAARPRSFSRAACSCDSWGVGSRSGTSSASTQQRRTHGGERKGCWAALARWGGTIGSVVTHSAGRRGVTLFPGGHGLSARCFVPSTTTTPRRIIFNSCRDRDATAGYRQLPRLSLFLSPRNLFSAKYIFAYRLQQNVPRRQLWNTLQNISFNSIIRKVCPDWDLKINTVCRPMWKWRGLKYANLANIAVKFSRSRIASLQRVGHFLENKNVLGPYSRLKRLHIIFNRLWNTLLLYVDYRWSRMLCFSTRWTRWI